MLYYVVLRYTMLYYVILCYTVMLCYVILLCFILLYWLNERARLSGENSGDSATGYHRIPMGLGFPT